LIFTADEEFKNKNDDTVWRPSENVIYELGAASFLYGKRIVIMKEEDVEFPANFKDIGYVSFPKDKLDSKALDIFKELVGFGILKVST
jgi:predicted nucleotide-binding protein